MLESSVPRALAELQKSLARHRDLLDSPLLEATRQLLEAQDMLEHIQVPNIQPKLLQAARHMSELQRLASPALAEIAESLSHAFASPSYQAQFQASAAGGLLDQFYRAETAPSQSEAEQLLASALDWVQKQIAALPAGWVSFKGMVWLLFTVILPLYMLVDDQLDEHRDNAWKERHSAEVRRRFDDIAAQLETLRPPAALRPLYIVTKRVRLRAGPSTDAEIVDVLVPNMLVEEIERRGRWIRIEFFDYIEGVPKSAWAYKRYLVPVFPEYASPSFAGGPFVGMWSDRQDMKDSSAWVRRIREEEWTPARE
jgi:hypothetical protein